jgi:hypothetical protein
MPKMPPCSLVGAPTKVPFVVEWWHFEFTAPSDRAGIPRGIRRIEAGDRSDVVDVQARVGGSCVHCHVPGEIRWCRRPEALMHRRRK